MQQLLLGIDIGTSACKVALFTREGRVVSAKSAKYTCSYPNPGWVEQDPAVWWDAVCQAVRSVLSDVDVPPEVIAGIGVDGQLSLIHI